jgi:ABC-type lipoprotein export system ATPase subunit
MIYHYHSNRLEADLNFGKVTVILGANGSGKSQLIRELRDNAHAIFSKPNNKIIYVEGGRAINVNGNLELNRNNFNRFKTIDVATHNRHQLLKSNLASRIQDSLILVDVKGQEIKSNHSDRVQEWHRNEMKGSYPSREIPPIEKLIGLFEEIFPKIKLIFNESNKKLSCSKNESEPYDISDLSDGEKQVISILTDIALLADQDSGIVIDEPELNLNPALAIKLWNTIESTLVDTNFIYATHSISFSQRENVSKIIALGNTSSQLTEINNLRDIPKSELADLLGSISVLLSNSKILVVEGGESSFDSVFYRWIIEENDLEILNEGSGENVKSIVSRSGVWDKISSSIIIKGVVDNDYKSDNDVDYYRIDGISVLKLHEAESYLCIPSLVVQITNKLGLVASIPSEAEIKAIIIAKTEEKKLEIAAQRVIKRSNVVLNVSVERRILNSITDKDHLEQSLRMEANEQTNYALNAIGEDVIIAYLNEELDKIQEAINTKNIENCLKLCPGKLLLAEIVKLTGARGFLDFLRATDNHYEKGTIELVDNLKDELKSLYN